MKVAVLGVGLIGGSIGLAARERVDDVEVVGFGRSTERLERARELGAINRVVGSVADALNDASLCFCCAPVGALAEQVDAALAAAPADCVVSDVGSVKQTLIRAQTDERFIGGHPIAGAETAGVEHARAELFEGAVWYLTPAATSSGILYERLHRFVAALGANPVAIAADDHDHLLATVSHLPHVLANALVAQAAGHGTLPRVGPSFRDITRVAGANSDIWTDIYAANGETIAREIDGTIERLSDAARTLRSGDAVAIRDWNDAAGKDRRRLLDGELAGAEAHELRLTVPNRPGIVAQVALGLGKAGVNIVDLALAPAADMRSGAITIWIAGADDAERARGVIEDLGFPVARP